MGDYMTTCYFCSGICVLAPSHSDRFPADLFPCRANHNCLSNMERSWYDDCSEPCTMGTIMPLRTKIAATVVAHVPLLWLVEGYPIASTGNLVRLVDNAPWELKMNWDVQDKFLFANLVRRCQTWQMCLRGITIVCLYYQLRLLVWQPENKLQQ